MAVGPKTYLYVSDAKVDMLLDGLGDSVTKRLVFKGRVGVPGIAGLEASSRERERGRFARAEYLCSELTARGLIGDVFDPESRFFHGELTMTWGFWNRQDGGYADVVFFTGYPAQSFFVGLGGSSYHTLEREGDRLQQFSNSGIQQLMSFMEERSDGRQGRTNPPGAWQSESFDADHDNALVPERVEFVAERLLDDAPEDRRVRTVIGSPIYVARASAPATKSELKVYDQVREREAIARFGRPRLEPSHPGGRWQVGKESAPVMPPVAEPRLPLPEAE